MGNTVVYDGKLQRLGELPSTSRAVLVKPDASRVYTFDTEFFDESGELRSYDLTQAPANGKYLQVGPGIPLTLASGDGAYAMTTTPDGATIFLVGASGVLVQPAPQ